MTTGVPAQSDHPAPHRAKVSGRTLLYGLTASPLAWLGSQIVNSALAQIGCFPATEPRAAPTFDHLVLVQSLILTSALAIALSGAALANGAWQKTRTEKSGGRNTLLAVGEGRTRFLAFVGVLTSLGFALADLFSIPALLFVHAC